jgi:serine O-acetyltransferase
MHRLEKDVNRLVDALIKDYERGRDIDVIDGVTPPDKDEIVKMIYQLRNIIFPSYFKDKNYRIYTVRNNLSIQLEDLLFNLSRQISLVLRYKEEFAAASDDELAKEGERLALLFLDKLTGIRELIETDLQAAYDGDPAASSKAEIVFAYPGLFAIMVNRIAHELYLMGVPLIPRIMTEYAHTLTGIDIHPGATLGKYFFIDHGKGIVIGETSVIGDNVKIYQGVTIGALSTRGGQSLRGKRRHPTIESGVTIYAGASILGGDTVIGRGSIVGGNAFITKSIPPHTKVIVKAPELILEAPKNATEGEKKVWDF